MKAQALHPGDMFIIIDMNGNSDQINPDNSYFVFQVVSTDVVNARNSEGESLIIAKNILTGNTIAVLPHGNVLQVRC